MPLPRARLPDHVDVAQLCEFGIAIVREDAELDPATVLRRLDLHPLSDLALDEGRFHDALETAGGALV